MNKKQLLLSMLILGAVTPAKAMMEGGAVVADHGAAAAPAPVQNIDDIKNIRVSEIMQKIQNFQVEVLNGEDDNQEAIQIAIFADVENADVENNNQAYIAWFDDNAPIFNHGRENADAFTREQLINIVRVFFDLGDVQRINFLSDIINNANTDFANLYKNDNNAFAPLFDRFLEIVYGINVVADVNNDNNNHDAELEQDEDDENNPLPGENNNNHVVEQQQDEVEQVQREEQLAAPENQRQESVEVAHAPSILELEIVKNIKQKDNFILEKCAEIENVKSKACILKNKLSQTSLYPDMNRMLDSFLKILDEGQASAVKGLSDKSLEVKINTPVEQAKDSNSLDSTPVTLESSFKQIEEIMDSNIFTGNIVLKSGNEILKDMMHFQRDLEQANIDLSELDQTQDTAYLLEKIAKAKVRVDEFMSNLQKQNPSMSVTEYMSIYEKNLKAEREIIALEEIDSLKGLDTSTMNLDEKKNHYSKIWSVLNFVFGAESGTINMMSFISDITDSILKADKNTSSSVVNTDTNIVNINDQANSEGKIVVN